jgi:hypothetical protein
MFCSIDLKWELKHQDLGQMQMYVNWQCVWEKWVFLKKKKIKFGFAN